MAALPPAPAGYPEYNGRSGLRPAQPAACFLSVKIRSFLFYLLIVLHRPAQPTDYFRAILLNQKLPCYSGISSTSLAIDSKISDSSFVST